MNLKVFFPQQILHPFLSLPFGQGTRMCVGKRFAELEVYILLSKIIQNFRYNIFGISIFSSYFLFSVSWPHKELGMITRTLTVPDAPLKFVFKDRK